MSNFNMNRLLHILSINRAHLGEGVEHLYKTVFAEYEPEVLTGLNHEEHAWGILVPSLDAEGEPDMPKTLFTSHVDTAETWDGQLTRINLLDSNTNTLMTDGKHVLGADCGAGMAVMLHMIDNKVPGYYLFTMGEEKGGIGAKGMADTHPEFLKGFDRAVAFDRRGTGSVITHMFRGRTCSDEFADALSDMLDCDKYVVMPDPTGSYTDTAEFTDLIGECTNVSTGYQNEHSSKETLDMTYIVHLAAKVLEVDWSSLPCVRKPGEEDPDMGWFQKRTGNMTVPAVWEDLYEMDFKAVTQWVAGANAVDVADMLLDMFEEIQSLQAAVSFYEGSGCPVSDPGTEVADYFFGDLREN